MSSRIALLAAVLLTGCIDPITPIALDLTMEPSYVKNADGTCTARVSTAASGIGTATWESVTLSRGGVAQTAYTGAEVANFWGAPTISAGEIQTSIPFSIPATSSNLELLVSYQIGGASRDVSLRMDCAIAR